MTSPMNLRLLDPTDDSKDIPINVIDINHSKYQYQSDTDFSDASSNPNAVESLNTISNLLNALLGAGILAVPSSFSNVGLIPSIILLFFIATLSFLSTNMVIKLQLATKTSSYDELTYRILGQKGQNVVVVLSLIFLVSTLLCYLVLGCDMLISFFAAVHIDMSNIWRRAGLILFYSLVLPLALSLPKSLKIVSYSSVVTIVGVLFFNVAVTVKGYKQFELAGISETMSLGKFHISFFSDFAIYALGFALPIVSCTIVNDYTHSVRKRTGIIAIGMTISFVLISIPAIISYMMFGNSVSVNILKNFGDNDTLFLLVRIAFFFIVTISYPCIAQNVMSCWSRILFHINDHTTLTLKQRIIALIATNSIPIIIALFVPVAKPILSIGGSVGGCTVNFVFPPTLYLILFHTQPTSPKWYLLILLILFGCITAVMSTYQSVYQLVASYKSL